MTKITKLIRYKNSSAHHVMWGKVYLNVNYVRNDFISFVVHLVTNEKKQKVKCIISVMDHPQTQKT